MATIYWLGKADAVAQVHTASIDSVDATPANNTFTVTIGGVAISQVGDTDAGTTAAALVVLLNASTHPYFAAITWTNPSGGTIVGTADTAGVPFVAALTETGAGTGAVTDFAATTASAGPNDWSTADNWSTGAVPVNSDDVILADSDVPICWGLNQSAVALASLTIRKTYTGKIGLRWTEFATSANGATASTAKDEYRDTYLRIGATDVSLGEHYGPSSPAGSGRIKLDLGSTAATVVVHDTARAPADTGLPAVRIKANSASTDVYVRTAPGGVGFACDVPGETTTVGDVHVSDESLDTRLEVRAGVTITSLTMRGGRCVLQAAGTVTSVEVEGGELDIEGEFTVTTLTVHGGVVSPNNTKSGGNAVTTLNHYGGSVLGRGSSEARTWATYNKRLGVSDPDIDPDFVTLTNGIALVE